MLKFISTQQGIRISLNDRKSQTSSVADSVSGSVESLLVCSCGGNLSYTGRISLMVPLEKKDGL